MTVLAAPRGEMQPKLGGTSLHCQSIAWRKASQRALDEDLPASVEA